MRKSMLKEITVMVTYIRYVNLKQIAYDDFILALNNI